MMYYSCVFSLHSALAALCHSVPRPSTMICLLCWAAMTHDASAAVATQHSHITLNCPCVNSGVLGNYYFVIFNIIRVSQFDMSLTLLSFSSTDAASDNGSVDGVVKF